MKKSIASVLTAAVVLGMASTTFATPTDEEVAELKARIAELERIIREQQNNSNNNTKEVENLNSRVTDLEKSDKNSLSEKFNIGGELRYSYWNLYRNPDASNLQLRLVPTFKVDEHFTVKARFRGTHNTQNDSRVLTRMDWAYLEAKYGHLQVNAGKIPLFTNVDRGLFADSDFSGVQILFGNRNKFGINLGNFSNYAYAGAEAQFNTDKDLTFGVGYHYSKQQDVATNKEKVSTITGGIGYKFTKDVELFGAVAHNTELKKDKTAYNIELDYKGANKNVKSSWGVYAAYRYAPSGAARVPTYNTFGQFANKKGFEVGASWTPYKSIVTDFAYFHGKYFNNGGDDRTFFTRARVFF